MTAIDTKVAAVTVSVVEPLTLPRRRRDRRRCRSSAPRPGRSWRSVATAVFDDVQAAELVRFCVVPSVNVPVAVNCCVSPLATRRVAGVTAIDASTAAVTVSVVVPLTLPEVAVIVVEPVASAEARPVMQIVATATFDEVQATVPVRFWVVPSVNVPVAVNCCVRPLAMDGLPGVTAIDVTTAAVTVSVVVPLTLPEVAVIVDEPVANAVAKPVA